MKTRKREGLIFYSSKRLDRSLLAVFCIELVHGHVRYVFGVTTDGYSRQRGLLGERLLDYGLRSQDLQD